VGLLSTLDSILNVPMGRILEQVRLSGEIREALEQHRGELGKLLAYTLAYESGATDTLERSGIDSSFLQDAYWESIEQAQATLRELADIRS
jgi:EAL and modified HD-GYP domain-containing signal transduction protein